MADAAGAGGGEDRSTVSGKVGSAEIVVTLSAASFLAGLPLAARIQVKQQDRLGGACGGRAQRPVSHLPDFILFYVAFMGVADKPVYIEWLAVQFHGHVVSYSADVDLPKSAVTARPMPSSCRTAMPDVATFAGSKGVCMVSSPQDIIAVAETVNRETPLERTFQ